MGEQSDLRSIGILCQDFQTTFHRIQKAIAAADIAPALKLNGVPYFSPPQIELIHEQLQPHQQQDLQHATA